MSWKSANGFASASCCMDGLIYVSVSDELVDSLTHSHLLVTHGAI